jgi:hypothetical protein
LSEKLVKYDRVELILPERREELIEDLEERLWLHVERLEIGAVDFLRDTVMIKVYYVEGANTSNSVNKLFNIPREQQ